MDIQMQAAALTQHGLSPDEAKALSARIQSACAGRSAGDAWRLVSQTILQPRHPFAVHRSVFDAIYRDWNHSAGPPPAWTPTAASIQSTNLGRLIRVRGFADYGDFHSWSANNREEFWRLMIDELGIRFRTPPARILDLAAGPKQPRWLVGARLNIAESCFSAAPDRPAIIHQSEGGPIATQTYSEMRAQAARVSNGLLRAGLQRGDAVAIAMPMTEHAVAAYLGVVQAGLVVVSIADSLAADEIAVRLRIADAKAVITQDVLRRGGKELPLFERVASAAGPRAIVIPAGNRMAVSLRSGDVAWDAFLSAEESFDPLPRDPEEPTNILFSSGTTGEPKAITWDHTSPIKAAADAHLHQDVQPSDCVAWPTNIGWMMGPWLIYGSLVNHATIALYDGAPNERGFGEFVAASGVTILGVIPSLVRTWRENDCLKGVDWTGIRHFSSTGECSHPDDMLFLMARAGYKPVIEYCGGTELAGAYIGSTLLQPNVPGTFTTASPGLDFVILDDSGQPADRGEAFLVPPAIGMSTRLLNRDHDAVYFDGTPQRADGTPLRRHGDAIERLPGGYYRALGRVDDTMNLGGIKVSSAEIERAVGAVAGVVETAAIAVPPPGGGPSRLWVFAVSSGPDADRDSVLQAMRRAVREHLNPLFKIERLIFLDALPRTPTNKVMRRQLRDQALSQEQS